MTDSELLALMFHHIVTEPLEQETSLRYQRVAIIEAEMASRAGRKTVYQADIQVRQQIRIGVGECGDGADRRVVESGFDVVKGDQLVVYRNGG